MSKGHRNYTSAWDFRVSRSNWSIKAELALLRNAEQNSVSSNKEIDRRSGIPAHLPESKVYWDLLLLDDGFCRTCKYFLWRPFIIWFSFESLKYVEYRKYVINRIRARNICGLKDVRGQSGKIPCPSCFCEHPWRLRRRQCICDVIIDI